MTMYYALGSWTTTSRTVLRLTFAPVSTSVSVKLSMQCTPADTAIKSIRTLWHVDGRSGPTRTRLSKGSTPTSPACRLFLRPVLSKKGQLTSNRLTASPRLKMKMSNVKLSSGKIAGSFPLPVDRVV